MADWLSLLPPCWSYGVSHDGRIFFIDEETKTTTWLHPVSGDTAATGHRKTPDLPSGWEEGYTFEGARCFINHNERKVTCKHPVTGTPSQDNCIFVVNDQPAPLAGPDGDPDGGCSEKKERPMSETSNYTGGSDYSPAPITATPHSTPTPSTTRPSRPSKKLHNFGKRSNSIKRSINAPVVKSSWLYKQDSTGMKLWKKRWFVLSDMCLFYYRDDKEDNILGSILLPSFHISMLSVDDHISKKYAFKATHPNMRTYYFCTDGVKEMESWMKVMTDAALVHTEPIRRLDTVKAESCSPQELNNLLNHRTLTRPVLQNNQRNRDLQRQNSVPVDCTGSEQPNDHRYSVKKDDVSYLLHKEGEKYLLHKDGQRFSLLKEELSRGNQRNLDQYEVENVEVEEKYAPSRERDKYLVTKDGDRHALQRVGERHTLGRYAPQREVRRTLSLKETDTYCRYGTVQVLDKHGALKEVKKYSTLREGDRYASMREAEKYATIRDWDRRREPGTDRTVTRISSIKLHPAQAAAIAAAVSASRQGHAPPTRLTPAQANGYGVPEQPTDAGSPELEVTAPVKSFPPALEAERDRGLSRTGSTQQLEDWTRPQRTSRGPEDDSKSVTSYQTLPRNMPSHRAPLVPRYPEGYRTMPRKCMLRPDSVYDHALSPAPSSVTPAEKRRSMRDDTMWQLYEWQQRHASSRQSLAAPTGMGGGHYGTLPNSKTLGNISEHAVPSLPPSPHYNLPLTSTPQQQQSSPPNPEGSSPVHTLERRQRPPQIKIGLPSDRRSISTPLSISPQSLQGKTPEELTLLLIKLRRQQAELNSLREHTLAQLTALGSEGPNAKTDVLSHHLQRTLVYLDHQTKDNEPLIFTIHTMIENLAPRPQLYQQVPPEKQTDVQNSAGDTHIDTKLSRWCEQDRSGRVLEEKLQQLHREKHTLETALLSASQELNQQVQDQDPQTSTQNLLQQRDVLQNGLLGTCREIARVSSEAERCWREYDWLEADVTLAKTNLLEQLENLGSPQTEPPSQQHIQIQKQLWRIQDVMEVLLKNKAVRSSNNSVPGSRPLSMQQKNEALTSLTEGIRGVPRPLLPQCHHSSEHVPPLTPHQPQPSDRPPTQTQSCEDDKASARTTANNQAPDYRLYKSEPELTTVKEEGDEANPEDKDKAETTVESTAPPLLKVPNYPVRVVPPRIKSPISPPESSTIASYVTLRKTKKAEVISDRPRSAVDPFGFGEREVFRTRMSVSEQLERIRRNQQASTLRERRMETHSSCKIHSSLQVGGACAEREGSPSEEVDTQRTAPTLQQVQTLDQETETQQDTPPAECASPDLQDCGTRTVPVLDQRLDLQQHSKEQDLRSSLPNSPTDNSFLTVETLRPSLGSREGEEPRGEEPRPQPASRTERNAEFFCQQRTDDHKHNNNMLAAQTFSLVSNDTQPCLH